MKSLNIIHKAMLTGQLLVAVFCVLMIYDHWQTASMKDYDRVFQLIAIAVAACGFLLGRYVFLKQTGLAKERDMPAKEKFLVYRKASLFLWAMLEGPTLLCIIFFYLTGNYAFIGMAVFLLFLFFILGPARQKLILYLGLSEQDAGAL